MTRTICTVLVIVACVYDVLVLWVVGDKASISAWFHSYRNFPTVWVCLGFLLCHFIGVQESGYVAGKVTAIRPTHSNLLFDLSLGVGLAVVSVLLVLLIRYWKG